MSTYNYWRVGAIVDAGFLKNCTVSQIHDNPLRYYLLTSGNRPVTFFPHRGVRTDWVCDPNSPILAQGARGNPLRNKTNRDYADDIIWSNQELVRAVKSRNHDAQQELLRYVDDIAGIPESQRDSIRQLIRELLKM